MGKIGQMTGAALLYGATWGVIGGVVGGIADVSKNYDIRSDISDLEDNLTAKTNAENAIVDYDQRMHELSLQLGEKCLAILRPYTDGNSLADVPEDAVVNDLFVNPTAPCGDNPTEIRGNVRNLRVATTGLSENQATLASVNSTSASELESARNRQAEDGDFNGLLVGSLLVGALVGVPWGLSAPRRPRSFWNEVIE